MAFRNLEEVENQDQVDTPEEPTGPSPEELRAAEAEKAREAAEKKNAELDGRIEQMERMVRQAFASRGGQQQAEVVQAKEDLGISEDDLVKDPKKYIEMVAEHIANKKVESLGQVVSNLAESSHEAQVTALKGHKYYEDLEPLLREHFDSYPQDKFIAGSARRVFNALVGEHLEELEKRHQSRLQEEDSRTALPPARTRAVEPHIETPPTHTEPPKETPKAELSEEEAYVMNKFNQVAGLNMTPEEWRSIEEGRTLPKNKGLSYKG